MQSPADRTAADLTRLVGSPAAPARPATLMRLGLVPEGSRGPVELAVRAARTVGLARRRRVGGADAFAPPSHPWPSRGPLAVVGYVQNPAFFDDGIDDVVDRILVRRQDAEQDADVPGVRPVLHIRRGDYVNNGWALPSDYYRDGLTRLRDRGVDLTQGIDVVGDDPMACSGLVSELRADGWPLRIPDGHRPDGDEVIHDFWSIVHAPAVVMSNSTFCWWATVVGDALRPTRTVVYPRGWIGLGPDVLHRTPWDDVPGLRTNSPPGARLGRMWRNAARIPMPG